MLARIMARVFSLVPTVMATGGAQETSAALHAGFEARCERSSHGAVSRARSSPAEGGVSAVPLGASA